MGKRLKGNTMKDDSFNPNRDIEEYAILSIPLSPLQFPLMSTLLLSWLHWFLTSTGPIPMTYPHSCWIFSVIRTFSSFDIVKHSFLLKHFHHLASRKSISFDSPHMLFLRLLFSFLFILPTSKHWNIGLSLPICFLSKFSPTWSHPHLQVDKSFLLNSNLLCQKA